MSPEEILRAKVIVWREQYGRVFGCTMPVGFGQEGFDVVWRRLTRGEFKQLAVRSTDQAEVLESEDRICELCVLYPENLDVASLPACLPSSLAVMILKSSGFGSGDEEKALFEAYKQRVQTFEEQIPLIIKEGLGIPESEVANMSQDEAMWRMAQAEWILRNLRGVELKEAEPQRQATDPRKLVDRLTKNSPVDDLRIEKMRRVEELKAKVAQQTMGGGSHR